MYCNRCGSAVPDGAPFCPNCGSAVASVPPVQAAGPVRTAARPVQPAARPVQPAPVQRASGGWLKGAFIAVLAVAVLLGALNVVQLLGGSGGMKAERYEIVLKNCTWTQACIEAREKGGKLVTFESEEELLFVVGLLEQRGLHNGYFLIGGRRDPGTDEFRWVDRNDRLTGAALNGTGTWCDGVWGTNEPTFVWDGRQEEYMELNYDTDDYRWAWNDNDDGAALRNSNYLYGYIIEYD